MKGKLRMMRAGALLAGVMLVSLFLFAPTPYVIYKPGLATDVGPMVELADPQVAEDSVMMLVTVRQTYPGPMEYLMSLFRGDWDVYRKEQIFREGETRKDYLSRQSVIMRSSQSNAIQAAYRAAGIPYDIVQEGVYVAQVIAGMPAHGVLKAGDRLVEIDGKPVGNSGDVFAALADKRVGDAVTMLVERNDERLELELAVGDFNRQSDSDADSADPRPGIGIQPADRLSVKPADPAHRVNIRVDGIGGPSAGLMFALEIYDQLTEGDLTRGYRLAGTGEIDPEGNVSAIGGVRQKVSAAKREGAEVFLVPEANYEEAKHWAERIGTNMSVVKVGSLGEALDVLAGLPAK
jgi:PDZ domain-containing protein